MGEGQLLAAQLKQLLAHAQIGDTQLWEITRQYHQRKVVGLVAQEKTHRLVDSGIGYVVVVIYDQQERPLPLGQLNEELSKQGVKVNVSPFWRQRLAAAAAALRRLLQRGDKVVSETAPADYQPSLMNTSTGPFYTTPTGRPAWFCHSQPGW